MLKEVLASNVAKLIAGCVCPVVGAGAIALNVPKVRSALHKATAPKPPPREARAKPRVRIPGKAAVAPEEPQDGIIQAGLMCPQPVVLGDAPLQSTALMQPVAPMRIDAGSLPADCGPVRTAGGGMSFRFAAVPEPATWAQMIAGFAMMGGALRLGRRRAARDLLSA